MKKISLFISMVLISSVIGGRAMAQTAGNRPPVRTADSHPLVQKTTIDLPTKSSGGGALKTAPKPLTTTELRAMLPLKPGGSAGTGSGATPGSNRAIPASHPGGVPGNQAGRQSGTPASAGAGVAPIKSAGSAATSQH